MPITETRIFLIRHGEAEGMPPGAFLGQADLPLSAAGAARMKSVAETLSRMPIAKVYTSPLSRCLQSAAIVAGAFGLSPIPLDGLKEVALGEWEGLTFEEISARYPEEAARMALDRAKFVYPGGESIVQMAARAAKAWEEIVVRSEGRQVAVVGHGGVNRAILAAVLDMPLDSMFKLRQDFGCVNVVDLGNQYPMLRLLNASPGLM